MHTSQFVIQHIFAPAIVMQRVMNKLDHPCFYEDADICAQDVNNTIMSQAK